jgi:predicted HAD superfamily Cof-like phosphohydrolase
MSPANPIPSTSSAIIFQFNDKARLLRQGFNARLEASFQIEEALEGFDLESVVEHHELYPDNFGFEGIPHQEMSAKNISRAMLAGVHPKASLSLVEAIDKASDAIVFAYGSLYKLGLSVQQAEDMLAIVADSVLEKVSAPVDEFGKLTKPEGFVGPEERIAEYLRDIGVDPEQKV